MLSRVLILLSAMLLVIGCAEQPERPVIEVDMTFPDRNSDLGSSLVVIDLLKEDGKVEYRLKDHSLTPEELKRIIGRLTSLQESIPVFVDKLEGVGPSEVDALAALLKESGAKHVFRRDKNNQAVSLY